MPAINFTDAVNAYANAGRMAPVPGRRRARAPARVSATCSRPRRTASSTPWRKGEQASLQAATGKADLAQVTEAVNNAEVAVQTVSAMRDRVVAAYQDIMRMPI